MGDQRLLTQDGCCSIRHQAPCSENGNNTRTLDKRGHENSRASVTMHNARAKARLCRHAGWGLSYLGGTATCHDIRMAGRIKLNGHVNRWCGISRGVSAAPQPRKRNPYQRKPRAQQAAANSFERDLCKNLWGCGGRS